MLQAYVLSMALVIGQMLRGRAASYHVTKVLKYPTVYQAEVTPKTPFRSQSNSTTVQAVIKCPPDGANVAQYNRERRCYAIDTISQSPCVRSLVDVIGHDEPVDNTSKQPQCMVFEWMETDLWQLPSKPFRACSQLPRIIARSVLHALEVFDKDGGVHTDFNPNNIFLSGVTCPSPVVKLGDLGNLMGVGPMKIRFQGSAIRAPEVWKDEGIISKADVWSLGITLAHWMASKALFGPSDKFIEGMAEAWSLAKMIRLMGPIGGPETTKTDLVDEFALAAFLEKETFVHPSTGKMEKFIKFGTIRQELESVEGPIDKDCIDFIESLLVVNPSQRPSATEALQHPWLQGHEDVD